MQISETSTDGLKREFKVVIPAQDIAQKVATRLEQLGRTTRIPGFRPGKVPMGVLRQRYGQAVWGEVLEEAVTDSSRQVVSDRGLRPAFQPKIQVGAVAEGQDLEYSMALEVLPDIDPGDFASLELERPVAEVKAEQVDQALSRLAESRRTFEDAPADHVAADGDELLIDFDGTVQGERKPGMAGQQVPLVLGSGHFVDTFEQQLLGTKPGDHRTVAVTFPEGYANAELAGQDAVFEVDVRRIRIGSTPAIDDAFAKELGLDDLAKLKEMVQERIAEDFAQMSRSRVKRSLLDRLAELHDFAVPPGMVEMEFQTIWERLQEEIKRGAAPEEAARTDDEAMKAEYQRIAERRVRLGLLLAEVGRRNNIQIGQDELSRAVIAEAQRYPGQERQVFEFFRNNPQALESVRAPLFEDKVVDHILGQAKVTDRTVSVDELVEEPDEAPQAA